MSVKWYNSITVFFFAYEECGILPPTFVTNHNHLPKPKQKSNR